MDAFCTTTNSCNAVMYTRHFLMGVCPLNDAAVGSAYSSSRCASCLRKSLPESVRESAATFSMFTRVLSSADINGSG